MGTGCRWTKPWAARSRAWWLDHRSYDSACDTGIRGVPQRFQLALGTGASRHLLFEQGARALGTRRGRGCRRLRRGRGSLRVSRHFGVARQLRPLPRECLEAPRIDVVARCTGAIRPIERRSGHLAWPARCAVRAWLRLQNPFGLCPIGVGTRGERAPCGKGEGCADDDGGHAVRSGTGHHEATTTHGRRRWSSLSGRRGGENRRACGCDVRNRPACSAIEIVVTSGLFTNCVSGPTLIETVKQ